MTATSPVPAGFEIRLDPATSEVAPGVWLGGQPMRVMRVTADGRAAWAELQAGPIRTPAAGTLARRLVDAGLAHPRPPVPAAAAEVTVVVPAYGRAPALDRCLGALGPAHPVIVVDDGSVDAAAVRSAADRHGATYVRLPHNRGPAAARNAGVAAARTELVAFVDSDTVPAGGWIDALAAHLADPLVAAVAPRIVPVTGPGWAGRFTSVRSALDLGDRPASVRPYAAVSYVPSAALLIRRSALLELAGPFDPALRVGEDVDLVWRLLAAGWRVRYEPAATVAHCEPVTWPALLRRRYFYGTSTAALARRHPENTAPFVVHPWFTATVLAVLAGRPVAAAAGFTGALLGTRRAVRRAGLPPRRTLPAAARGVLQTGLGLGRYGTQFAAPVLLAALAAGAPRRRLAAAALLVGPAATAWRASPRALDPARYVLASVADDVAYGAGVLAGCVRERTARPLIPRTTRRQR